MVLDKKNNEVEVGDEIMPDRAGFPYEVLAFYEDFIWCVSTGSGQFTTFNRKNITIVKKKGA